MASLRILAFDHEGRPIQFDTWLDDLQLYLLSDSKDSVLLFDLVSGAATAPPTTANSATRSRWLTRDAAAGLAIRNHLPLAECAHFGQHRTAHALYDAVVARYSSPATAALGRLLLPYLFPKLSAFATVEDLVSHLRASNARYRATVLAEFLDRNQPPMLHTQHRCFSRLKDAWRAEFGDEVKRPRWADLLMFGVAIFDLDFDVIFPAMYALSVTAEGDCYRCVPPDPGIAPAALGVSESGTLPGTTPAQAFHTFTLGSGASHCFFRDSTTLTPLSAPVPVCLADPSGGSVVATVLPCSAVQSGSLSGLHLPSFSTNLTLLLHHHLGHPSLPRLRGMHSRLLVSGLPRSLPPLPPSPAPPCLPCVERRQRTAPHSSSFPPTTAPLQTLHMDRGPARVSGQCRKLYSMLVVDNYMRYTTVFPLRGNGQVVDVLIPWIRAVCLQLRERFRADLPVLRLHSDRGGEFSSDLLRDYSPGEGILQSFTLLESPQQNGIAKHRIGLVMEVACTSMIHAAGPHILWPFPVRYAAHQLNLWPRVSLPETLPTLRWTGKVGDASVFRVWDSRAFVRNTSSGKLSASAIPYVFLGFVPDASGWQFYHPTLRVSQVDPPPGAVPGEVVVDLGAARGTASGGAEPGGAEPRGAETRGAAPGGTETGGAEPGGAEPEGVEPRGAELEGAESGDAEPQGAASSGGSARALPRLSPQQLREWLVRRVRLRSGATGAGGARAAGAGGTGVTAGAGVPRGTAATGPGGARTRGTRAVGIGGVGGAGAGDPTESGAAGAGGSGSGEAGAGGAGVGGIGAGGARVGGTGAQVLGVPSFTGLTPPLLCPPSDKSQPSLQPASPLPAPSPYTEQTGGLTERREHTSRRTRATSPTVSRLLATAVIDPSFESAAACHLDYTTALIAESASATPPSVGGECALGTDVLEDRQEDFECLAAAVPRFASMLLATQGDPDAPDILTPRSYKEAITGPYSSQWQAAMDAEMASQKSRGTYVDEVPPPGANTVDGMWIFRGVEYFHTFSRAPKMTTLWVLLHIAAQRDYELHSLDFSTAFLQGSLHEEISLCRSPGFTGSFPAGTQWSLRQPVYGLRQAPRKWHDTQRTTLVALGFATFTADPSLFPRTDTSLPLFYVLVYIDDLVLQRFGFQFSSPQPTPLSTGHSLLAPPLDESVEPSGPYPELVGCLMYLITCTQPDLAVRIICEDDSLGSDEGYK
ncbi:unnamed protein product [Closterium sp. NIES-53]